MPRINPQDVSWDDAGGRIDPGQVSWDKTPSDGEEAEFQTWYSGISKKTGLNPDPDDPNHFYDYRAAHKAGAMPDKTGHWPSQFKREGHPRMVVDGVNTKTGEPVDEFAKLNKDLEDQALYGQRAFEQTMNAGEMSRKYDAEHPTMLRDVTQRLKSKAQVLGSLAYGAAAFVPSLVLKGTEFASSKLKGETPEQTKKRMARVDEAFQPPAGLIGELTPEAEGTLGLAGKVTGAMAQGGGAAAAAIGGEGWRPAGEIAGDIAMLALPVFAKKAALNYIEKGLKKNLADLIKENNKIGLSAEESAAMADSFINQAQRAKVKETGHPLNAWEKWKAQKGFGRMGEELRAAREGGPAEPFSPEFAAEVAGPKRITGPMDAFSPADVPAGDIVGPLEPYSPDLAGGIRQVRRPTLPPGQGFDLKGEPYGPPPPTIDSLRRGIPPIPEPPPPPPSIATGLRVGGPIETGNPTGTLHFEYEGKTWAVPFPTGNFRLGSRYADQWARDQALTGKAVPLGEKPPSAPRTNDLPQGQGEVPSPEVPIDQAGPGAAPPPPGGKTKPKKPKKETNSFLQWVKNKGGIWDKSLPGEVAQLGKKEGKTVGLIRKKTGRSLDELAVLATENGWLPPGATTVEFLELINNEIRGKKAKRLDVAGIVDDTDALNRYYEEQIDPSEVIWDDDNSNLAPSMTPPPASGAQGGQPPGQGIAPQTAGSGPPPTAPGQEEPFTLFEERKKYGDENREIFDYDEEMNPFLHTRRLMAEEKAQREAFVKKYGETPFQVDIPGSFPGNYAIVHKSTSKPNIWQVSRFDKKGPFGHTEYETYDQALRELVDYDRADLNKIKLSRTVTLESPRWEFGGRIPFGAVEVLQPGDIKRQKADKSAQSSLFGEQPKEPAQAKKKGPEVEQIGMFDQPKAEAKGPEPPRRGTDGIPEDPKWAVPGSGRPVKGAMVWENRFSKGAFGTKDGPMENSPEKAVEGLDKQKAARAESSRHGEKIDDAKKRVKIGMYTDADIKTLTGRGLIDSTTGTEGILRSLGLTSKEARKVVRNINEIDSTSNGTVLFSVREAIEYASRRGYIRQDIPKARPEFGSRGDGMNPEGVTRPSPIEGEITKKAEKAPAFEDMVKEAARWRSAAMNADAMLGEMYDKAHLDHKKGIKDVRFGNTRITTKGDLDDYLMANFGIDATTARDVSNELTKKNIPRDKTVSVEDFKGEPWADKALEVAGKEKTPEPKKTDAPPKEEKKPEQLSLIKKEEKQLTLFERKREYGKDADLYHGGADVGKDLTLRTGKGPGGGDSGAIFLTPSKAYAKQYEKGGLYSYKLQDERIFDITSPSDKAKLRDGFLKDWEKEYDSKADALKDYDSALKLMMDSEAHGAVDWATASAYMDQMKKAGFDGAKFLERPGENIKPLPSGGFDVSGPPVYSYAIFKEELRVAKHHDGKEATEDHKREAEKLGVTYKGPWKDGDKILFENFTDNLTHGDFVVKPGEDIKAALLKMRKPFVDAGNIPESALNLEERQKKYGAEPAKNLAIVHNLSIDNLSHALKLGGLPVPSTAVINVDKTTFDNFGDITLIAHPNRLGPEAGKENKYFDADIYSPRYPRAKHKLTSKGSKALVDWLKPIEDSIPRGAEGARTFTGAYTIEANVEDAGLAVTLKSDEPLVAYAFLHDIGKVPKGVTNSYEGRNLITDAIKKAGRDNFEKWVDDKIRELGIETEGKLWGGANRNGNSKWIPEKLETVVRMLKKDLRDGEGFNYGVPSVRAKVAKRFRTLKQIQADRDRIISKEDMDQVKDAIEQEFVDLAGAATDLLKYKRGFSDLDAFSEHLKEAIETRRFSKVFGDKSEYYEPGVDIQGIIDFVEKLRKLPTAYFEGKIQRAVGLHEFDSAIVPHNTPKELIDQLKTRGLQVETYQRGDEQARRAAIKRTAETGGALFENRKEYEAIRAELKQRGHQYNWMEPEYIQAAVEAIAELRKVEALPMKKKGESGIKTLGNRISAEMIRKGRIDFEGREVSEIGELVSLAQVLRNPKFETHYWFGLKNLPDGRFKIVGYYATTSKMPGETAFTEGGFDKLPKEMQRLQRRIERWGADQVFSLHNHPTGKVTFSKPDAKSNVYFRYWVPKYKGMIVIDHEKFGQLLSKDRDDRTKATEHQLETWKEDKFSKVSVYHPVIGMQLLSPSRLAGALKEIRTDAGRTVLFFMNAELKINGVQDIPSKNVEREDFTGYLRNRGREFGSDRAIIVTRDMNLRPKLTTMMEKGYIHDAAFVSEYGVESLKDYVTVTPEEGTWLGKKVIPTHVSQPVINYGASDPRHIELNDRLVAQKKDLHKLQRERDNLQAKVTRLDRHIQTLKTEQAKRINTELNRRAKLQRADRERKIVDLTAKIHTTERALANLAVGPNAIIKRRQMGEKKENRFAPPVTQREFEIVKEFAAKPPMKGVLREWFETAHRMWNHYGKKAKELFYRPATAARFEAHKETVAVFKQIDGQFKRLPGKASRRIGIYAIAQQPRGLQLLREAGIDQVPTLTPQETAVYRWARDLLSQTYDRLQAARKTAGQKPFPAVQDYFTFMRNFSFWDRWGLNPATADLNVLPEYEVHLRTTPFRFAKRRTGGTYPVEIDAKFILKNYMKSALTHINVGPAVAKMRELVGRYEVDGNQFIMRDENPTAYQQITQWIDYVSGTKPTTNLPEIVQKSIKALSRNIVASTLAFSVRSTLIQPTSLLQTWVRLGTRPMLQAVPAIFHPSEWKRALTESHHLSPRIMDIALDRAVEELWGPVSRAKAKAVGAGFYLLRALDYTAANYTWLAAEQAGKKAGLTGAELINFADDITVATQGSGAKEDISRIQRTVLGHAAMLFQTFNINQWGFFLRDTLGLKGAEAMTKRETMRRLLYFLVGATVINTVYEDILGMPSPLPTPVNTYLRAKDEGKTTPQALKQSMDSLAGMIPGMGGMRFGSTPLGAAAEWGLDVFKKGAEWGGLKGQYVKPAPEIAMRGMGIPGTSQIYKTVRGLDKGLSVPEALLGTTKSSMPDKGAVRRSTRRSLKKEQPGPDTLHQFLGIRGPRQTVKRGTYRRN